MFSPILLDARNPGPLTGDGNHTYLVFGRDRNALLVDAGVGDAIHLSEIDRELDERGAALELVAVTHAHPDHVGGASSLAGRHPEAAFVKYPWPADDACYPVDWQPVRDGDAVWDGGDHPITAVHTPGHSPDHLVFWHEASRTAFSGDLVIQDRSVTISWSRGGDLNAYLGSLHRVMALDPAVLLPAHGPVITNPAAVLSAYVEHRLERERQVIDAIRTGHPTVQTIADYIYDGLGPTLMAAARENVRAHLEKLRADGMAFTDGDRWTL